MSIPIDVDEIKYRDGIAFEESKIRLPFKIKNRDDNIHEFSGESDSTGYSDVVYIPCNINIKNLEKILDNYNLSYDNDPTPDAILVFSIKWMDDHNITLKSGDFFTYGGVEYVIQSFVTVDYLPTEPAVPIHQLATARRKLN